MIVIDRWPYPYPYLGHLPLNLNLTSHQTAVLRRRPNELDCSPVKSSPAPPLPRYDRLRQPITYNPLPALFACAGVLSCWCHVSCVMMGLMCWVGWVRVCCAFVSQVRADREKLKQLDPSMSGRDAETVVRDRKGAYFPPLSVYISLFFSCSTSLSLSLSHTHMHSYICRITRRCIGSVCVPLL